MTCKRSIQIKQFVSEPMHVTIRRAYDVKHFDFQAASYVLWQVEADTTAPLHRSLSQQSLIIWC